MSKTSFEESHHSDDELLDEYRFNYEKVKPNRFAQSSEKQPPKVVVLDEDVARFFTTSESVNKVLRALIEAMPLAANGLDRLQSQSLQSQSPQSQSSQS